MLLASYSMKIFEQGVPFDNLAYIIQTGGKIIMEWDYKSYGKFLEVMMKKLQTTNEICEENRSAIIRFNNYLKAKSQKVSTQSTNVYDMYLWAKLFNKPFADATKEDVIESVAGLEGKYKSHNFKLNMKAVLKKFYKWLRGVEGKGIYPDEVKWIELKKERTKRLPETILTVEEVEKIANATENLGDRALILTLYESGCRIGEILQMKIGDIHFDSIGCTITVDGKTGARSVRLMDKDRVKALLDWLNIHPQKQDSEAFVWITLNRRECRPVSYAGIQDMIARIRKKAGISKDANLHAFRHSRATHLAKTVPQAVMNKLFGWTEESKMSGVYYHLSNKDVDEALLKANGLKISVENVKPVGSRICLNCGENNPILSQFCKRCNLQIEIENRKKEFDSFMKEFLVYYAEIDKNFKKVFRQFVKDRDYTNLFT